MANHDPEGAQVPGVDNQAREPWLPAAAGGGAPDGLRTAPEPAPTAEAHAVPRPAAADFERRYQMAMDNLLAMKAKNLELQQQLAKAQPPATQHLKSGAAPSGDFNWESEKRRLLAALETDFEPRDPVARAERLRIEDVLRATDNALDYKDHEIQYWKKRCDELTRGGGGKPDLPVPDTAQLLDADAIVQQERAGSSNSRTSCSKNSGWPKSSCRWSGPSWPASRPSWKTPSGPPKMRRPPILRPRPIASNRLPADAGSPGWD